MRNLIFVGLLTAGFSVSAQTVAAPQYSIKVYPSTNTPIHSDKDAKDVAPMQVATEVEGTLPPSSAVQVGVVQDGEKKPFCIVQVPGAVSNVTSYCDMVLPNSGFFRIYAEVVTGSPEELLAGRGTPLKVCQSSKKKNCGGSYRLYVQ
jgi:hypothetical protein